MRGFASACANAGNNSTKRCHWFGARDRGFARKQTVEQLRLIARIRKLRRIELCKIVAAIGTCSMIPAAFVCW
jgi:hypothetical protein